MLCLDGALADDEGDREEEDGRGDADRDDERHGALLGFLAAAQHHGLALVAGGAIKRVPGASLVPRVPFFRTPPQTLGVNRRLRGAVARVAGQAIHALVAREVLGSNAKRVVEVVEVSFPALGARPTIRPLGITFLMFLVVKAAASIL